MLPKLYCGATRQYEYARLAEKSRMARRRKNANRFKAKERAESRVPHDERRASRRPYYRHRYLRQEPEEEYAPEAAYAPPGRVIVHIGTGGLDKLMSLTLAAKAALMDAASIPASALGPAEPSSNVPSAAEIDARMRSMMRQATDRGARRQWRAW